MLIYHDFLGRMQRNLGFDTGIAVVFLGLIYHDFPDGCRRNLGFLSEIAIIFLGLQPR